jgi:2',3'-cyclic-nucleotide 2'-phosphodiesterase (5'-nucleotidase family)
MPIANPGWISPEYSFAIREERIYSMVDEVRAAGVDLVVCLSHNGFDVDRKMAGRVKGIDVILTGHTHNAVPEPIVIGETIHTILVGVADNLFNPDLCYQQGDDLVRVASLALTSTCRNRLANGSAT